MNLLPCIFTKSNYQWNANVTFNKKYYIIKTAFFQKKIYSFIFFLSAKGWDHHPAGNCMFNVNNRNTRTKCEICQRLLFCGWFESAIVNASDCHFWTSKRDWKQQNFQQLAMYKNRETGITDWNDLINKIRETRSKLQTSLIKKGKNWQGMNKIISFKKMA